MSDFIIAVGHTASGNIGCGVVDRLDESNCTREIGALVVEYLQQKGYGVNLLRIDKSNSYNCEDCYERANQANEIAKTKDIKLYVEIHINAGGGSGPEVLVFGKSEAANQYAAKVCNELSSILNLPNRGVKTRNLIVLNKTVMPAILVECLFADSDDADKYDPDIIAKAIVNGLVSSGNSSDGEWKAGWNKDDVGWWYCTDIENKYYYTSQNGWQEIKGEWYIFDDRGYALQNCWYQDKNNNAWYYLDENCKMVRGSKEKPLWKWIDNKCYAFDEHGRWIK
ncbi:MULTISPECIES: N-acetylmuramoyl-L-alanine amidase [Clostridium]|uniref:N-acetylmuramoyl-L-alanine amidase n=1 Tax=Clostridium beijerinckii TaxID=1520 RepID=A0A1S9N6D2_CLOBE|nr:MULTISPECIES: N-acetylmuramoyl-L-alanine amidase [Clostridium]EKQ57736.1 MAG: N-acetylmuramoyl-L-alanine amidase [Clostridium sp. Maddingley MBC34-26]MZK52599.1 N-acetylmuramoyl-L-alanine amidase [Clostridium beijerinckii]MZK60637.1 N-acetylmuramoyl-L-alanine amidase [Clostridium beijerinckii]MZK70912.1 N-acetylmuramoyl-L-alanine amidase [Clostridium beijerinckii]MZK76267.1 N-acetylmuramoyl-L-alanine amidase [Clostridium beijerinckii]